MDIRGTLKIPANAASSLVLGSDSAGVATWQEPTGAVNVKAFGATGNGTTDDTTSCQNALNTGSPVYFPAGNYKISSALTITTGQSMFGDGVGKTTITQSSTTAHGISGTDQYNLTIERMTIAGPNSGSGDGIHLVKSTVNPANVTIRHMLVFQMGGNGVFLNGAITTHIDNTETQSCGNHGFFIENGTSTVLTSCYDNGSAVRGFNFSAQAYTTLNGCAADNQGSWGYVFSSCLAMTAQGCGAESQTAGGSFEVIGGNNITLIGCESFASPGIGFYANSSAADIAFIGCLEKSPGAGATASFQVNSGCAVTVINPNFVTAVSYASGTTILLDAGKVTAPSGIVLPSGASTGYILNTDASGNASWISPGLVPFTLTDGSSIAVNAALGNLARITLTASGHTIANPTNSVDGGKLIFEVIQDATGGRTVSWGTNYLFGTDIASPTLSTGASATDYVAFTYNSTAGKWRCIGVARGF